MYAGDADRSRLRVQTIVEGGADCQHAATGPLARLEDDDLASCLEKEISRTQSGEACADDDYGASGIRRLSQPLQQCRRSRSGERGELEKPSTSDASTHV